MAHEYCVTGHGAANVTLGIPRLREIVMTASQKPKTPSMNMMVCSGISHADVDTFCKRASRLTLSQVVDNVSVTETMVITGEARLRQYTVDFAFFPKEEYESEYDVEPSEILATFAVKFPLILKKEIQLEMRKLDADLKSQITELGKGKKSDTPTGNGEVDDVDDDSVPLGKSKGSDNQSEIGDGDAEDSKRARQRIQQATYESDDEGIADDYLGDIPDEDVPLDAEWGVDETDPDSSRSRSGDLQVQVQSVAKYFVGNMHQATTFAFNESACTFQIEVRARNPVSCES